MMWLAAFCLFTGVACGAGYWWHTIGFRLLPHRLRESVKPVAVPDGIFTTYHTVPVPLCVEAADTIESLRASLTRAEEEREEAKRALTDLADAADQLNVWPRCEEHGMGEIHAVESYSDGCAYDDKWTIAFDVFYKQGTCFEVDWSDFRELNEALLSAQPHRLSRESANQDQRDEG